MNGLADTKDMVHLQVRGRNQLFKEIEETLKMEVKNYDEMALHRNNHTGEVEGKLLPQ